MYYNLSEEEQFYIATTHAMMKGGYTHEEIDKFWQCEDTETIIETFKTLEFSSRVSMRDPDLLEYFYGDGKDLQENVKRRAREFQRARPFIKNVMGAIYDAEDMVRSTVRGVRNWNNPKQADIERIKTLNRYLSNPGTTGVGRTKRSNELRGLLSNNRNNITKADIPDLEDIARTHFPNNTGLQNRVSVRDPKLDPTSGSGSSGNYTYKPDPSKPNTGTNAAQAQRTGQATADALPKSVTAPATSAASGTPTPPKTGGINFPITAAAGGAIAYGANELRKGDQPKPLTPAERNDLVMSDADETVAKSGRTDKTFCPPGTKIERTPIPGTTKANVRCKTTGGNVDIGDPKNKNKTGQGGPSTTPPPGAFNISPKGSPRRTELEAQIKRDNAARRTTRLATDPNKRADQDNFDSAGQEIKIGDTVGGSDMQPSTVRQPPAQQQPPSTQQPPSQQQPSTKTRKRRYRNIHPEEYAYEFILDRLISEGHASSLAEAEYVFKQLDDEYIQSMLSEQNLSYSDATMILKNHQYDKKQLMNMSRKATETGQHGLAQACYDAACKMKI